MLREIRTLPEAEVIRRWAELYAAGKHKGYAAPDLSQFAGRDATWIEVDVPHDMYDADWNDDSGSLSEKSVTRAQKYALTPGPLPPGIATYGGRRTQRRLPKIRVSDGNHRAYAAFLRGSPTARFYMPFKEREHFREVIGQ